MGFSDHVPLRLSDGTESGYRVPVSDAKEYCREIKALAEKYKDKIDIKVGFEMEYLPAHFEDMLKTARELGTEYLILGQHFAGEERPVPVHASLPTDDPEALNRYVACVLAGIESGVFTYVAHPDVLNFIGDDELYRAQMRRICAAARETGTPLEINFLGLGEGRRYPTSRFFGIAAEIGNTVIYGVDAHTPEAFFDKDTFAAAEKFRKDLGLELTDEIRLIKR